MSEVDGNGETVPGIEAGLACDRRVDADHLTAHVHQWATRVSRVDRGVGLDKVLNAALSPPWKSLEGAALRTDNSRGDGEGQTLAQRIANGKHPFPYPGVIAVAQRHRLQPFGIDLQHSHVSVG